MVIVYPRTGGLFRKKNKVVLSVCDTPSGLGDRLRASLPSSSLLYGIWAAGETMSIEQERKGPAEEALQKYTSYMRELLTAHHMAQ